MCKQHWKYCITWEIKEGAWWCSRSVSIRDFVVWPPLPSFAIDSLSSTDRLIHVCQFCRYNCTNGTHEQRNNDNDPPRITFFAKNPRESNYKKHYQRYMRILVLCGLYVLFLSVAILMTISVRKPNIISFKNFFLHSLSYYQTSIDAIDRLLHISIVMDWLNHLLPPTSIWPRRSPRAAEYFPFHPCCLDHIITYYSASRTHIRHVDARFVLATS